MMVYKVFLFLSVILVFFSSNWFFIWVCLELSTLSLVVLLSYHRTPRATEATVKYFVVQSVASIILLLGILFQRFFLKSFYLFSLYGDFGYFLVLLGLFVKMAVFPNPFWFVDVVGGLGLVRGFYVVMVSKMVPVYLYSIMVSDLFFWLFVVVGLFSAFFGTVFGIKQTSIRKMMSLSSIAHFGWMIISFSMLSISSCFFIFFLYVMMVLPLFVLGYYWTMKKVNKVKNLYHNFFAVLVLLLSLLSLGGFPPLIGFFYKWVMFFGLVNYGSYLVSSILMMFSLISLYFYLLICYSVYSLYLPQVKYMFYSKYFLSENLVIVLFFISMILVLIFYIGPIVVVLFL